MMEPNRNNMRYAHTRRWLLPALLSCAGLQLVACIGSSTTPCGSLVCPAGKECDHQHGICISPQQRAVCEDVLDGTLCEVEGASGFHCDRGVCIPGWCGDGIQDTNEECDDGPARSDELPNACRSDCRLAYCGDGVTDDGENCDDGNFVNGDGCALSCLSDETCGTGFVDVARNESCDDGNSVSGDGCSETCVSEYCGNGLIDLALGEICDDGNTQSGDGCAASCLSDESCGNGIVDFAAGEQCDDGNTVSADGCSGARCRHEQFCPIVNDLQCFVPVAGTLGGPSTQGVISDYSCDSAPHDMEEHIYRFVAPTTGTYEVLNHANLWPPIVFVLEDACAPTACIVGPAQSTFDATAGWTYFIVAEAGSPTFAGTHKIEVACPCSTSTEACNCADGVDNDGDGLIDCADGDCAIRHVCEGPCASATVLQVGCGSVQPGTNGLTLNNFSTYPCAAGAALTGGERTYLFVPSASGQVSVTLDGLSVDLDLLMLPAAPTGGCDATGTCVTNPARGTSGETISFPVQAGASYFLVVDGFEGATGAFNLSVTCP